jgi:opacity protein-like surface antigen
MYVPFAHAEPDAHASWRDGLYIGATIGRSKTEFDVKDDTNKNPLAWWGSGNYGGNHVQGVSGAVQVGYNHSFGNNILLGVEAEIGHGILNLSSTDPIHVGPTAHVNDRLYGTLTGRAGYVIGPALVYAKAGYGRMNSEFNWQDPLYESVAKDIKPVGGVVVGAGVEYQIMPHVSLKADYTRMDFSDTSTLVLPYTSLLQDPIEIGPIDTFRLGINYQLDGLY